MAKFLTTRAVSAELETIINEAKDWLFLISPYLDIPETLFECIKSADSRKVKLMIIYGKKEKQGDAIPKLSQLNNISMRFSENLHAKCYFNERSMIITSMNLYAYSEINNREMGILIQKEEDHQIFDDAQKEVMRILENAEEISLKGSTYKNGQTNKERGESQTNKGYCVRCGATIKYNTSKPLCSTCYKVWSKWNDPDYTEKFCHHCGRQVDTSVNEPVCPICNVSSFSSWIKGIFK